MKLLLKRILSHLPTKLPVGVTEFYKWSDEVIELSGEFAEKESMRQALANMIIHVSPLKGSDTPRDAVPKAFFVKGLRKGAANQIASYVFQDIRQKLVEAAEKAKKAAVDLEEAKAAEALKQVQAEVTAGNPPANELG